VGITWLNIKNPASKKNIITQGGFKSMKNLRKYLAVAIAITMILSLMAPVVSANSLYTYEEEAMELNQMDLYRGINPDGEFDADLGSTLNRQTAAVMLLRMYGEEDMALEMSLEEAKTVLEKKIRDADKVADWAARQVAYGIEKGYIAGFPDKYFRPESDLTGQQYCTLNLKMLGYTFEFNNAGDTFATVAELDLDESDEFGVGTKIRKDILVGISHRALLAKFEGTETRLVDRLIEKEILTFEQVKMAAPSVASMIEETYVSPEPTATPTPSVVYTVTEVTATNGSVVVKFDKAFETAPEVADFSVEQSVLLGTSTTPVVTSVTATLNVEENTATLTVTPVAEAPLDQVVSYNVAYKGGEAVKTNDITIAGTSVVSAVSALTLMMLKVNLMTM
jgi:hypothetical protein